MNEEFIFNIDKNLFNLFSSNSIKNIKEKYQIENFYELNQIHSDIIKIIDNDFQNNQIGDALITNKTNTPLLIKTADCIPIIIYDKENKILAVVHSGWKGTLNDITIKTIKLMINKFNINTSSTYVYLYPSIRKCHFEVEIDVYKQFKEKIKNINKYTTKKENKYYIDLQQIIIDKLHNLGINNIIDSNICTHCNHDKFYSYRYNHTDKRNYLIAMIKE